MRKGIAHSTSSGLAPIFLILLVALLGGGGAWAYVVVKYRTPNLIPPIPPPAVDQPAADARCSVAVRGGGMCKAIFRGVQFNGVTGKCEIVSVSGCGASYAFDDHGYQDDSSINKAMVTCQSVCGRDSVSDTGDWKTYRNEEYGFEVRYPDGWLIEEDPPGVRLILAAHKNSFSRPSIQISKRELGDKSVQQFFSNIDLEKECTRDTISNRPAYRCIPVISLAGETTVIVQHDADSVFVMSNSFQYTAASNVSEQILSTFMFVESPADTSTWKTYTNELWGFTLRFPPSWDGVQPKGELIGPSLPGASSQKIAFNLECRFSGRTVLLAPLSIFVFRIETFESFKDQNGPQFGAEVARNTTHVFLYSRGQDACPEDIEWTTASQFVDQIPSTFRFTNP